MNWIQWWYDNNSTQIWRDSSSHGSSCRTFVHRQSCPAGWRSSSSSSSLPWYLLFLWDLPSYCSFHFIPHPTYHDSCIIMLVFIFHYYQSMNHHSILCLGLVEEDTMSRLSSCPSPTMIGALHGRDVVLRFVSSSSACFLHLQPPSCQQKLDQEFAVKRRSSWPFVGAHQVDRSHDGGCRRFCCYCWSHFCCCQNGWFWWW